MDNRKTQSFYYLCMYIHTLHCSTPGLPTLTAKVKANVFLRTLWMADELQDYVAVMACLWLSPPKRPFFVEGRMGEWKKRAHGVR